MLNPARGEWWWGSWGRAGLWWWCSVGLGLSVWSWRLSVRWLLLAVRGLSVWWLLSIWRLLAIWRLMSIGRLLTVGLVAAVTAWIGGGESELATKEQGGWHIYNTGMGLID